MAIVQEKEHFGKGIVKEIDQASIGLVLEGLQQNPYQYPEKSFIREVASNCIDSIAEKHVAIDILNGKSKVEDHFLKSNSIVTADSQFDPEYYDPAFLDPEDKVDITYVQKSDAHRDQIIIHDSGVGLGGKRLKGYFKPAYSSKRLSAKALGKFGIGAKAGLATGVESYQLISRYNGREYHFDIYNDRYHSTVPKFNMETGEINPSEIWKVKVFNEDGSQREEDLEVFYRNTTEYNSVSVMLDVKNPIRNKKKYIDAVKTQLTYFDLVTLKRVDENFDLIEKYHVQTEILYEDEHIIIPKDDYYAVPHYVINNVNYGPIDFGEMEMDKKRGNIGVKIDPSAIDVSQGRETVRYTDRTRESTKQCLENSVLSAQNLLDEEVKSVGEDFLAWIRSCKDMRSTASGNNLVTRLAGLADVSKIDAELRIGDRSFKYTSQNFKELFKGFKVTKTEISTSDKGAFKTKTSDITSWGEFSADHLVYRKSSLDRISPITMGYMAKEMFSTNHIYMMTPMKEVVIDREVGKSTFIPTTEITAEQEAFADIVLRSFRTIEYSEVDIPDDFKSDAAKLLKEQEEIDKEKAKEAEEKAKIDAMTAAEIRKRDGTFLYHTFKHDIKDYKYSFRECNISKTKEEMSFDEVADRFSKDDTIYGTKEDIPLIQSMLHFSDVGRQPYVDYNTEVLAVRGYMKFVIVSKQNAKYMEMHATHVRAALQTVTGTKLSLMKPIVKYNTTRRFATVIDTSDFSYLSHFENVDDDAYRAYLELSGCRSKYGHGHSIENRFGGVAQVEEYLDKTAEFQVFLTTTDDPVEISNKASEMFNAPELDSCDALDMELYAKYMALVDYTEQIVDMLRPFASASNVSKDALREYIALKQIPKYSEFLKGRYDEFKVSPKADNGQS